MIKEVKSMDKYLPTINSHRIVPIQNLLNKTKIRIFPNELYDSRIFMIYNNQMDN